ncbi:hypothetical protein IPF37_05100 [bacterium]|nr:MAG: hypothetical protein IPF37_05100 [bacterium]
MVNKFRIAIGMASCVISAVSVVPVYAFDLADLEQSVAGNQAQGTLSLSLHEFMDNLKELDYYTAKKLVIVLPGTGREIVIDWGFGGSGSMFDPLPTVEPQERCIKNDDQQDSLAGLGSVLLKNELYKRSKSIPLMKWLVQSKVTPIKLCILKLLLLAKNAYITDTSKIKTEVVRLLVRLMLSEELYSLDETRAFSSYLPEGSVELLNDVLPGAVDYVDEVWHELITSTPRDADHELLNVQAVVVHNKVAADQAFKFFKNYEGDALIDDITRYLQVHGIEVVDYNDLAKLGNIRPMVNGRMMFGPITQLAAVTTFDNIHDNKNFEKMVGIAADKLNIGSLVLHENNGTYWLLSGSNKLEVGATIKHMAIALIQALRSYVAAKKQLLQGTSAQAIEYREKCENYEKQCLQINDFLASPEGQASQLRLHTKLDALHAEAKNAHQLAMNEVAETIVTLQKEADKKVALIEYFEAKEVTLSLDSLRRDVDVLHKEIERLQEMRDAYASDPDQVLVQKQQDLQDLLALSLEQNQSMNDELMACIDALKKEIAAFDPEKVHHYSLEQKIALRERVAEIYEQETRVLTQNNELKKQELAWLSGIKRRIEELKFARTCSLSEVYLAHLQERAQTIRTENKQALKLAEYYEAMKEMDGDFMTEKLSKKLSKLEAVAGFMFDKSGTRFLTRALEYQSEWQAFLQDFDGSVESFVKIKEDLSSKMATIIKRSVHVQANMPVYRHLLFQFLPEFSAWFDQLVK